MHPASFRYIRRSLIWIIFLVFIAVLANYFYSRHVRNREEADEFPLLSSEVTQVSEGSEILITDGGTLKFKLRARQVIETKAGKYFLQGIEAFDYNSDGNIHNEIHSRKAEYDSEKKTVDFREDVRLVLGSEVELHTDSMHYNVEDNVGTTQDRVNFNSKSLTGEARGLEYDSNLKSLDLNSDINFLIEMEKTSSDGSVTIEEIRAVSDKAFCSEDGGRILFQGGARLESDATLLTGDTIEMRVDSERKKLSSLISTGNAFYRSGPSGESQILRGDRMQFGIHAESQGIEVVHVSGHAVLDFFSASGERRLQGEEIDLYLDPEGTMPLKVEGRSGVQLRIRTGERGILVEGEIFEALFNSEAEGLETIDVRQKAGVTIEGATGSDVYDIDAEHIRLKFRQDNQSVAFEHLLAEESAQWTCFMAQDGTGETLSTGILNAGVIEIFWNREFMDRIVASGDVVMTGVGSDSGSGPQNQKIYADQALIRFYPRENRPKDMDAEGAVRIEYEGATASPDRMLLKKFRTSSDSMKAVFAPGSESIHLVSGSQWGNFEYKDADRTAKSGRCDYDALEGIIVLSDSPEIFFETGSATGDTIKFDRNEGMIHILGNVRSTLAENRKTGFLGSASSGSHNIILADTMRYDTESGDVRYSNQVQLLSEIHQLQAEMLDILDEGEVIEADGGVRHYIHRSQIPEREKGNNGIFSVSASKQGGKSQDEPIYIKSSKLKYLMDTNILSYSGNASLRSSDLNLTSGALEILLNGNSSDIVEATASENVVANKGNMECKGEVAHYFSDPKRFVVTGSPLECFDPERGRFFPRRLTYNEADDSIQLESF